MSRRLIRRHFRPAGWSAKAESRSIVLKRDGFSRQVKMLKRFHLTASGSSEPAWESL
jgi:hypothetical protein